MQLRADAPPLASRAAQAPLAPCGYWSSVTSRPDPAVFHPSSSVSRLGSYTAFVLTVTWPLLFVALRRRVRHADNDRVRARGDIGVRRDRLALRSVNGDPSPKSKSHALLAAISPANGVWLAPPVPTTN
jgi:hypothetical protein